MRLSTAEMSSSMVEALKGVNKVMQRVNAQMDIHSIQDVLKEFSKNSEKMEMQQEMVNIRIKINNCLLQMNDAIDAGMDTGNDEEEADKIYS